MNATRSDTEMRERRFPIGAEVVPGGTHIRIWAPKCKSLSVKFHDDYLEPIKLNSEESGYFSGFLKGIGEGTRYSFLIDDDDKPYPDPLSRFQPEGPHGPSQIIDSSSFHWADSEWKGASTTGMVLYEMHIGTFTREGTWLAAIPHLKDLVDLGVTCLEVMPIAEFPGQFNWGYDGVDLFAPTHVYGSPDDVRAFIDHAHSIGLGVVLDVVYNHFGPDGNYITNFSDSFLSSTHATDWGQAINFDGKGCEGVREFFITNARYWIEEFHFDGFRFDATQNIYDDSEDHILKAMIRILRSVVPEKTLCMIGENEPQNTDLVRSSDRGGFGLDSLWNDDFHHAAKVSLTGRSDAYFTDYAGSPQEFISAAKWGYLYQGQRYKWQRKRRGSPAFDLAPNNFINFIQNHDQIANYANGQRVHELSSLAQYRNLTAVLLLSPQIPMLFQGQEFASSSRFSYFGDHGKDLAKLTAKGRATELAQFPSLAVPEMQKALLDPSDPKTFFNCKLSHEERMHSSHAQIHALYRDLLKLRKEDLAFVSSQTGKTVDGAVMSQQAFVLRYFAHDNDDRLVIANLGKDLDLDIVPEPLLGAPSGMRWICYWSSEHPKYGGLGTPSVEYEQVDGRVHWFIPAHTTVVLKLIDLTEEEIRSEHKSNDEYEALKKRKKESLVG